ncbi:hypothetical protein [Candidatus Ichthyocystis sparus]|nr:hypothetical protein [Candidatus Ichthyocystis sparus]
MYRIYLSIILSLAFFLSNGCFAQTFPGCSFVYADPIDGIKSVPVNHHVAIYYQAQEAGLCRNAISLRSMSSEDEMKLRILSDREWTGVVGGGKVIWGEVVAEPEIGFTLGEYYSLEYNGEVASNFRISPDENVSRGRVLSVGELPLNFKNFPHQSLVTKKYVNRMFEDVLRGILSSSAAGFEGENEFYNSAERGDDSHCLGQLVDIFSNMFGYYSSYGEPKGFSADGVGKILLGLLPYLRRQYPNLFYPNAKYDVRVKRMIYSSVSPNGEPVNLSAALIYPNNFKNSEHPFFVNIHHPTMPSSSAQSHGDTVDVFLGVLLASHGNIVVLSDLLGHGVTSGEVEPYLINLPANGEYFDAMWAAQKYFRDSLSEDISSLPMALVGISQGAHDAMEFGRFIDDMGIRRVSRVMVLAGPYNVYDSVLAVNCVVSGSLKCSDKYSESYLGYESEIHRFAYKMAQGAVSYRGLPEMLLRRFFDESNNISSEASRAFYLFGDYRGIHNISAMGSLPGSDETFNNSEMSVTLYHSARDHIIPVQNTIDTIEFLRSPRNSLGRIDFGNCRESSLISYFVQKIWVPIKGDPLASHIVCIPYFLNDVFKELSSQ